MLKKAEPTDAQTDSSPLPSQLRWVDQLTDLLDTKYQIPGTKIRFGADFLLGLLPGVGDGLSMGVSGLMIAGMARHGASPRLITRMLINVVIDTGIGSIPILGNVFDLFFKANQRNLRLMKQYHQEGKHRGPVWPILLIIAVVLMLCLIAAVWLAVTLIAALIALW